MNFRLYKPHYKALLHLGIPIMIGQLGMIVLSFADTLMIGHHSTEELAAASFVNNVFNLFIIFANGFSFGLTPVVGAQFGRNELHDIGRSLKNSLLTNMLLAILITAICFILYLNIHWLGQPVELISLIREYFLILTSSIIFILLFNAFKQFADGITDTKTSMYILLGGNLLNIIGNYVLIYGKLGFPEMGLNGAGYSTLFSRIIMVVAFILIFFFSRRYKIYREGFFRSCINKTDFLLLNKLGWPIALQAGMETASFTFSAVMVGWLGAIPLASHQIMITISNICFMMYYGMGSAVAVRISNFNGQHDIQNVQRTANAGFHLMLCIACCLGIPILLCRNHLGSLFTDNAEVATLVAQLIIPFIIYQLGDGLQITFANALRGIADVKPVMYIAFIAYFIISIPLGYFFGFVLHLNAVGIWMALPFGLTSAGIMYYLRFLKSTRKGL